MPILGTRLLRRGLHTKGDWRVTSHEIVRVTPALVYVNYRGRMHRLRRANLESGVGAAHGAARYFIPPSVWDWLRHPAL